MKLTVKVWDSRHQNSFCLLESIERYTELTKTAIKSQNPNQARKEAVRLVTASNLLIDYRSACIKQIKKHACSRCMTQFLPYPRYYCIHNRSHWEVLRKIDIWLMEQGFSPRALDEQLL